MKRDGIKYIKIISKDSRLYEKQPLNQQSQLLFKLKSLTKQGSELIRQSE